MATLPQIDDPFTGTPSQPVALRLVPLITQLSVETVLTLLSEPLADGTGCILTAHEHRLEAEARVPTRQVYTAILHEVGAQKNFKNKLALLPANHYVLSDELVIAFDRFIDLSYSDRKLASEAGMELIWNVALSPHESLIGECPDFSERGARRKLQRILSTAARHEDWQRRVTEKSQQYPGVSHSRLCHFVWEDLKKLGPVVDERTIRRQTKKPR